MTRILIVGGGASGVLLALHLLHEPAADIAVTIIERQPVLGAGIAYATNHADHLLNVRASNMSAFPDDPDHFVRWLRDHAEGDDNVLGPDSFAPRRVFRDYLAALYTPLLADGRLRHLCADVLALHPTASGVVAEIADGATIEGDLAVVATGNEGPVLPMESWRFAGWSEHGESPVAEDAPVVVIGTGLTMVDRVLSLLHGGHVGPITAISRRGLSPQAHRPTVAATRAVADVPLGAPLSVLMRWMRAGARAADASGAGWRSFFDALRPHTQSLWRSLPVIERRRFLRHARPFWDVHRHRIAPSAEDSLRAAAARGQLRIMAAHIAGFEAREQGVDVQIAMRRTGHPQTIHADAVFECRGRSPDITRSVNPVLRNLLESGAATADTLRLGLAVAPSCAVIDAAGVSSDRIFAMGPVTTGTFWEIVAIPDIRQQAQTLAATLRQAPS